jgi:tRNA A-37 threonylcarbamoyl transferase component Bud32
MAEQADYIVVRTAAGVAYGTARLPEMALSQLLEHPETLLWRHLDRPVKLSHESLLVEAELPLTGGPVRAAYKQFRPRGWWKAISGRFRTSRAMRGWTLGRALLALGVATPRPLAVCEPRHRSPPGANYLATEWIPGENLHLFGWRLARLPIERRLRLASRCAESTGRLLGRMHAAGVVHRDLKAANLVAVEGENDVAVHLVDLDGVRLGRRPHARRRAADLARLAAGLVAHPWVTPAICRRFLRAYVEESRPQAIDWKRLWRAIAHRTNAHVQRQRRQGRQTL